MNRESFHQLASELEELENKELELPSTEDELLATEDEDLLEEEEPNFSSGDSGISRLDLQEKSRKTQNIATKGRA